jgi:hypothetical protein
MGLKIPAEVKSVARELGCMLEVNDYSSTFQVVEAIAPMGQYWRSEGVHCLVESRCSGDSKTAADMWADLTARMRDGLELCRDGGCNKDCDLCR